MKILNLIFLTLLLTCQPAFTATKYGQFDAIKSLDLAKTWTLPASSDTMMGRLSIDTMTNKTFDADGTGNSITNIENADIKTAAAIAYSKLNLSNSIVSNDITVSAITSNKILDGTIVSGDISGTAGILYSQILLTNSIVSGDLTTGSVTTGKILDGTIADIDVSASAAIAYSKLSLTNSLVSGDLTTGAVTTAKILDATITSADISTGGVASLNILDATITSADISTSAGINAASIGDGTVSTTEFQYINSVTSNVQTQLDAALINPMTTGGDSIYAAGGGVPTRLPNGADGQVIKSAGGTAAPQWETIDTIDGASNYSIAASVAANALTINLVKNDGNNASATDPIRIPFRHATATNGTVTFIKVTGALSTVISSGSTAGHTSGVNANIYIGVLNNAGTPELCWSTRPFNDDVAITTTAEGGAGAADSGLTIYSTTARTGVAVRYVGKLSGNQATAGTWTAVPTVVTGSNEKILTNQVVSEVAVSAGNGHGSTGTKVRRFSTVNSTSGVDLTYADSATAGMSVTINTDGLYAATYTDNRAGAATQMGITRNSAVLTTNVGSLTYPEVLAYAITSAATQPAVISVTFAATGGDVIRAMGAGGSDETAGVASNFRIIRIK